MIFMCVNDSSMSIAELELSGGKVYLHGFLL